MPTILVEQHSLKLDNFQNSEMVMKCQALKIPSTNNPFLISTVYQLSFVLYTAWKNEFLFYLSTRFIGHILYLLQVATLTLCPTVYCITELH